MPTKKTGFLNRIENSIEHDAGAIKHGLQEGATKINNTVHTIAGKAKDGIEGGLKAVESGVLKAGKDISELEADVFPSGKEIIGETALVIGGIAILGIVVLKFL